MKFDDMLEMVRPNKSGLSTDNSLPSTEHEFAETIEDSEGLQSSDPLMLEYKNWLEKVEEGSLPEVNASVITKKGATWYQALLCSYFGPGALIAVGYMDPGNWATDIAGGSAFGFTLLFVVLLSSIIAMILQAFSVRVGLATNRDLAQACRDSYSRPVAYCLWAVAEIAIAATDLAEVIGSAIALNLLFGLPIIWGVCITAVDVVVVLCLNNGRIRVIEVIVGLLVLLITGCFIAQLALAQARVIDVFRGFLPSLQIVQNKECLTYSLGNLKNK
jgi:manganese transport protein